MTVKEKKLDELESIIDKAIKKVNGRKENDLCKFIPMNSGGYMHHFTLKKMKYKNPSELSSMIEKFILKTERPLAVAPKTRAARGSRKRRDQLTFTKTQLDRLLNMARLTGDKEMVSLLSPKRSLAASKRDLIQVIRQGIVDHDLWNAYVEAVNNFQAASQLNLAEHLFNSHN
ncbi:MAG: hypothetical protein KBC64_02140 [Simkaniaceae bacterium]|nr:hypothetical protein [Simkaniaceae bacterium]